MNRAVTLGELVARLPLALAAAEPCEAGAAGELHATLAAHHETASHELVAELDAYVCPDDANQMMVARFRPEWLPAREVVRVGCAAEEASEVARDIFHSWVRRIRSVVPTH